MLQICVRMNNKIPQGIPQGIQGFIRNSASKPTRNPELPTKSHKIPQVLVDPCGILAGFLQDPCGILARILAGFWEKVGKNWPTKVCVFIENTTIFKFVPQLWRPTFSQLFPNSFPNPCKDSHKDPTRILQSPARIPKDLQGLAGFSGNLWIPCGIACGILGQSLDSLRDFVV